MRLPLDELVLHVLFPRTCAGCREDLPPPLAGPLCGPCLAQLKPLGPPVCRRCGADWDGLAALCPACRGALFSVDAVRAAFLYRPPFPALLHAFKFQGHRRAGEALAGWMGGFLSRWPELAGAEAVVPVPLHPARERERGFNQCLPLAAAVARAARLPLLEALERRKGSTPQSRLRRRDRAGRLAGAFAARPGLDLNRARLLLIDDVCTSGETLEACGRALREAGAADVRAYVLARV